MELGEDDIVLLGALNLGGRVELDGTTLKGFYETVGRTLAPNRRFGDDIPTYEWFMARGKEETCFSKYTDLLQTRLGKTRFDQAPRVWCSWYSLYRWIHEDILEKALHDFGDMPFDVFQVDDGWQLAYGDWEPNRKFSSGMQALADKISATGRTPGLWLAPFMVSPHSQLAKDHPDWLLRDEKGNPVSAGITWSGHPYGLDVSHPEVLESLAQLIQKVRDWGYGYLKLDFLYIGALIGNRYKDIPREVAYRNALQVIRAAAGDAYILACGAPIIPSLGLCDGLRIGPDVSPYWLNKPLSVWLNNPNDTSTQNAIRTSVHRLWLKPLVNIDPDVLYFRSKYNALGPNERQLLQDLGTITGFKATSDLPQWLTAKEQETLSDFLKSNFTVEKKRRYEYQIDEREVDFSAVVPVQSADMNIPVWLAQNIGLLKMIRRQVLPAIWESKRL